MADAILSRIVNVHVKCVIMIIIIINEMACILDSIGIVYTLELTIVFFTVIGYRTCPPCMHTNVANFPINIVR